ncbi:MAG: porin family protein [Rhizobiales bacterium]|nr:porin family protein [Hyphomicrobiales bacterium]
MKKLLLAGTALAALASGAQAADLGVRRVEVPQAIIAVPAFTWTGFYVGAHIGWAGARSNYTDPSLTAFSSGLSTSGVFGGVQAGYNWQINQFVLGVEGDLSLASNSKTVFADPAGAFAGDARRSSTPFLGSLRLRAGYAFDRALIYATGGLGVATFNDRYSSIAVPALNIASNSTRVGYAVGGGVEYAFTPNWTAKLEYLYYGFGDRSNVFVTGDRVSQNIHTVKLGVNYLFNTGGVPLSARY